MLYDDGDDHNNCSCFHQIIDVFEERGEDGVDQKAFNVIAAFSDRLKHVE